MPSKTTVTIEEKEITQKVAITVIPEEADNQNYSKQLEKKLKNKT